MQGASRSQPVATNGSSRRRLTSRGSWQDGNPEQPTKMHSPVINISYSHSGETPRGMESHVPIPGNDTSHNSLEDENHLCVDSNAGTPRAGSRCESPAAPQLEITPYPGPESEDELGPPCPTCYGKGHVDMDDEEDTIAIIPMTDKRLNPRRTKQYMFIAVVASIVVCTALTYFLFERTVSVEIASAYVIDYNVSIPHAVGMTVVIKVRVSNQNYFKVTMNNLSISIDGPENVGICNYKGEKANSLTADALSSSEFSCQTIIMFKNDHAEQIQEACERSWAWNHFILILNTKVNWSYLIFDKSHIENIDWDCFTCRRGMFPTRQVKHSCYERNQNNTPSMVPLEPQIPITLTSSGLT